MKVNPHLKQDYPFFYKLSTRWKDNDVYGHINNVVYYARVTAISVALLKVNTSVNLQ